MTITDVQPINLTMYSQAAIQEMIVQHNTKQRAKRPSHDLLPSRLPLSRRYSEAKLEDVKGFILGKAEIQVFRSRGSLEFETTWRALVTERELGDTEREYTSYQAAFEVAWSSVESLFNSSSEDDSSKDTM